MDDDITIMYFYNRPFLLLKIIPGYLDCECISFITWFFNLTQNVWKVSLLVSSEV